MRFDMDLEAIAVWVIVSLFGPIDYGLGCSPESCGIIYASVATGYTSFPVPQWFFDALLMLGRLVGIW